MDTLKNLVATIISIEQKVSSTGNTFFKIKMSDNRSYTIWKIKKDGNESVAYAGLKTFGLEAVGKTVEIAFNEKNGKYEDKKTGQTKPITYRSIVCIKLAEKPSLTAKVEERVKDIAF